MMGFFNIMLYTLPDMKEANRQNPSAMYTFNVTMICCKKDVVGRVWQSYVWCSPSTPPLQLFPGFCVTEAVVPQLLRELCSNDITPKEHLEIQQALFKQFAEILDFTLKFDDLKVSGLLEGFLCLKYCIKF